MNKKAHPGLIVIDRWLKYQLAQGDLPGFQASIRQNGRLIFSQAYGFSNIQKKSKYTTSHTACIASQSKVFTAAMALWLESERLLRLSDRLVDRVTELKNHRDRRFQKIKLMDLLSHRSGIVRDSVENDYWCDYKPFLSSEDLIREVLGLRLVYEPGQFTKYSNVGFALMGLVFERVTGQSYVQLMTQYLKKIKFMPKIYSNQITNRNLAQGYLRRQLHGQSFSRVPRRDAFAFTPAAGLCANTESTTDYFHHVFLSQAATHKKMTQLMRTKKWPVANLTSEEYGLGTMFSQVGGQLYVGHSGGVPGFSSQTWVVPKTKYGFGFITNVSYYKSFHYIRGMAEILRTIEENFNKSEFQSLTISQPLANNHFSTLFLVGRTKALAFSQINSMPTEDVMVFHRHKKTDYYYSDHLSGYKNIGEPLRFFYKSGQIESAQLGGLRLKPSSL